MFDGYIYACGGRGMSQDDDKAVLPGVPTPHKTRNVLSKEIQKEWSASERFRRSGGMDRSGFTEEPLDLGDLHHLTPGVSTPDAADTWCALR